MVNPYGQPDHKISVFLFTTPLSFQPILAGLLGLTMQPACNLDQNGSTFQPFTHSCQGHPLWPKLNLTLLSKEYIFPVWKTFWSTVTVNAHRPRGVGEKSIYVLLKSLQGKANSSIRVKTKPYQAIFAFLCVPIVVVVVLLVKSFHLKWPKSFYTDQRRNMG